MREPKRERARERERERKREEERERKREERGEGKEEGGHNFTAGADFNGLRKGASQAGRNFGGKIIVPRNWAMGLLMKRFSTRTSARKRGVTKLNPPTKLRWGG